MWERFFNWQSDMDWTWGPFVGLRPARTQPMQPWVWVRLFTALSLAGSLFVVLIGVACVGGPKIAARQHWSLSPAVTETLGTLAAMGNDPNSRVLLIGMIFCLPPLFFATCLPFHVAWNRRAARLSLTGPAEEEPEQGEAWPPAPRQK